MTWKDLKVVTLQKMFSITGNTVPAGDDAVTAYTASMPGAANEAARIIASTCRGITKRAELDSKGSAEQYTDFEMKKQFDDFYRFCPGKVFRKKNGGLEQIYDYGVVGDHIYLPSGDEYVVYYKAYPETITHDTPDDADIGLCPEEAAIMPLYIASQLYKDDDIGQSVQMLNEFEVRREELAAIAASYENQSTGTGSEKFSSIHGWW